MSLNWLCQKWGQVQSALNNAGVVFIGPSPEAIRRQLVQTIPSGRVGTIDDIADAVCFLVSERASYVNGAALVVDGSKSVVI